MVQYELVGPSLRRPTERSFRSNQRGERQRTSNAYTQAIHANARIRHRRERKLYAKSRMSSSSRSTRSVPGVGPRGKLDGDALSATAGPSHGAMALGNITTALIQQKTMPPSQRSKCEDCRIIEPYFGFVGEKARWCGKCAKDHRGAIDMKHKQCQDCQGKRPHFGLPGAKVGLWCGSCAKSHEGAVPVGRALCGDCGVKQPSYGLPADGLIRWCSGCAKQREGAVDVEHNREYKPGRNR